MDPITAVGFAASILTFVDFAWNVISGAREIYKSPSGVTPETVHISKIIEDLQDATCELEKEKMGNSKHEKALHHLASECTNLSKDMDELLNKLKSDRCSAWGSVKKQLARMRRAGEITALETRIAAYRSEITLRLNLMIKDEQFIIKSTLEEIKTVAWAHRRESETQLQDIQQNLLAALKNFSSHMVEATDGRATRNTDIGGTQQQALTRQASNRVQSPSMDDIQLRLKEILDKMVSISTQTRILRQLWFPSMLSREDSMQPAAEGTFEWLLGESTENSRPQEDEVKRSVSETFLSWLRTGQHIFHFSGKAGSGKSTLMRLVFQHPATRRQLESWAGSKKLVFASFYFWTAGNDKLTTSLEGLYRSILYKILDQCHDLIPEVFSKQWPQLPPKAHRGGESVDDVLFRLPMLQEAFEALVTKSSHPNHKFCLFIDGLDEYEGDRIHNFDLAEMLSRWAEGPDVKICSSSRPYTEFLTTFSERGNTLIRLHELNRQDIYLFALQAFKPKENPKRPEDSEAYLQLSADIAEMAEGVFLWAALVIRLLWTSIRFRDPPQVLRAKLDSVPIELDQLYSDLLKTVKGVDRIRSNTILLIASNNPYPEPLNAILYKWIDDLKGPCFPVNNNFQEQAFSQRRVDMIAEDVTRQLDLLTKGLLETTMTRQNPWRMGINWYNVQFFHRTVRDFLREESRQNQLRASFPGFCPAETYIRLRQAEFAFMAENQQLGPFYSFDSRELLDIFMYPLCRMQPLLYEGSDMHSNILSSWRHTKNKFELFFTGFPVSWLFSLAAYFGQIDYVKREICEYPKLLASNVGTKLLYLAACGWNIKLTSFLIEKGVSPRRYFQNPRGAVRHPVWLAIVHDIMKGALSVFNEGKAIFGPRVRMWDIFRLLLQHGADEDCRFVIERHLPSNRDAAEIPSTYSITLGELVSQYDALYQRVAPERQATNQRERLKTAQETTPPVLEMLRDEQEGAFYKLIKLYNGPLCWSYQCFFMLEKWMRPFDHLRTFDEYSYGDIGAKDDGRIQTEP